MPRTSYSFDIAAAAGGPLIAVRFADGRETTGWLSDKNFIRQMNIVDQKLLRLYENAINALGSSYNVFAGRAMNEAEGAAFIAVIYQREGVQRKRWVTKKKDEVVDLTVQLLKAGIVPGVSGDPEKDDFVRIYAPFKSADEALRAYEIIDRAVQASPKYWGW